RGQVPVPGMEDVPDPQPVRLRELLDSAEDVRQARPRDDSVLHVVVGCDPTHRSEGRLASFPEKRARRLVRGRADLERPALATDPLYLDGVFVDLCSDAFELDEEHGACARWVAGGDC